MIFYKIGDKSKAICDSCQQVRTTTFQERDVPLSSGKDCAHDLLVAVCDHCDHIVAIPQQSVSRIQEPIPGSTC